MTEIQKKKLLERVMVYLRVRPQSDEEMRMSIKEKDNIIDSIDSSCNVISIRKEADRRQFTFDNIFPANCIQKDVYAVVGKPIVTSVLEGYNGTILAYGQTGTGKTHTMIGGPGETKGLIPRCIKSIFTAIKASATHSYQVKVGFLQLYMEVLQDLIHPDPNNPIRIREDSEEGMYLSGITWVDVHSVTDCMSLLVTGDKNRNVASTSMNLTSSRSHAVFMVKIEKREKVSREELDRNDTRFRFNGQSMTKSTLYLVDLAGSERVSKTKVSGMRLDEAKNINLALLALGNCIQALTEGRTRYIPFRDSKLTRLLEDSLGGNSKTSLMVTIGPSSLNYQESVSSLLFGTRAMKIQNAPELNVKIDYKALCAKLQAELDKVNDKKNIENIDIDQVIEENNALKIALDKVSTEKLKLEDLLEELKKGSDVSIVEGNIAEFQRVQRYHRARFEKQEQEHKKFLAEVDKMLLDQEEQISSLKNLKNNLELRNTELVSELTKYQNELEKEKNDREIRAEQLMNEIEDLKQKVQLEKTSQGDVKKSNNANHLAPIKIKPQTAGGDLKDKVSRYEIMIANLEEEVMQYDRRLLEDSENAKKDRARYEAEISQYKEKQAKYESEIKKLKKQQVKLIKVLKREKNPEDVKSSHDHISSHNSNS